MTGLTKVTAGVIAANAVVDSFGTQSITGDKLGLTAINANNIVMGAITGDKLGATSINANNIVDSSITSAKIDTVANSKITGTITATQMAANSVNASILQTNSVENYMADSGRPLSNRNIIINGDMRIAQRNVSVTSITSAGYYTADRWYFSKSSGGAGTWTMNVESSGPTNTEFSKGNSVNVIVTTANTSLPVNNVAILYQAVEGLNVQGIKKGTSAAQQLAVSFWVKSSNTGTYITEIFDTDNTRQCSQSYTIDAADTWEKKTLIIPADTTGEFDNDNAESLRLNFWLAAGTNFTSGALQTTWASSTNANRVVGQLNLANRVGNYFAMTGVQLEVGSVATPFERRPYGTELALCQRYFESSFNIGTAVTNNSAALNFGGLTAFAVDYAQTPAISFNVSKRAAPTITPYSPSRAGSVSGQWNYRSTGGSWAAVAGTAAFGNVTQNFVMGIQTVGSPLTSGTSHLAEGNWTASAEL